MNHSTIYFKPNIYAGWPANHGAWQHGDEILFGFLVGPYATGIGMHNIAEPYTKMLARSMDGGRSWNVFRPDVDFNGELPTAITPDWYYAGGSIIRVCGVYDHGGETAAPHGSFYLSANQGRTWGGPYAMGLTLADNQIFTGRTSYLQEDGLLFGSIGDVDFWGLDYTVCMKQEYGKFIVIGEIGKDDQRGRAVMPAVAKVGDIIYCAVRRRQTGVRSGWIELFKSDDGGQHWGNVGVIGDTGSHNGNPPALKALPDGRLLCVYGNRDYGEIRGVLLTPSHEHTFVIRNMALTNDIGYPQLFIRRNGTPICVYYWINKDQRMQHIAMTEISLP